MVTEDIPQAVDLCIGDQDQHTLLCQQKRIEDLQGIVLNPKWYFKYPNPESDAHQLVRLAAMAAARKRHTKTRDSENWGTYLFCPGFMACDPTQSPGLN